MIPTNEMHYSGNLGFSGQNPDDCRPGHRPRVLEGLESRTICSQIPGNRGSRSGLPRHVYQRGKILKSIMSAFTHKSKEIHTVAQFHSSTVSLGNTAKSP